MPGRRGFIPQRVQVAREQNRAQQRQRAEEVRQRLRRRIVESLWLFEPALVAEPDQFATQLCQSLSQQVPQYIGQVASGGRLVFPHVDSCLAIAFVLKDGGLMGAHVSMQMGHGDLVPAANARELTRQLLGVNPAQGRVEKVIFLGQSGTWLEDLVGEGAVPVTEVKAELQGAHQAPKYVYFDTFEYAQGADLVVDGWKKEARVYKYKQRTETNIPEAATSRVPFGDITGDELKRLPKP